MTEFEMQTEEFTELIKRADTVTKEWVEKCLILSIGSSGFNAAFEKAVPLGEKCPPVNVMRDLVNEWAERENEFLESFRKLTPEEREAYLQGLKREVASNEQDR